MEEVVREGVDAVEVLAHDCGVSCNDGWGMILCLGVLARVLSKVLLPGNEEMMSL